MEAADRIYGERSDAFANATFRTENIDKILTEEISISDRSWISNRENVSLAFTLGATPKEEKLYAVGVSKIWYMVPTEYEVSLELVDHRVNLKNQGVLTLADKRLIITEAMTTTVMK